MRQRKPHFLAATLLALLPTQAEAQNYTFDFESEQHTWGLMNGHATVVKGGADGSAHCLQLEPHTVISFEIKGVKELSEYRLTAWLRTSSGQSSVSIQTTNLDQGNVSLSSALATWTKVEERLTIPQIERNHARLEVLFDHDGKAWVDEIRLERIGDYTPPVYTGIPPLPAFEPTEDFGVMQQPAEKQEWLRDARIGMFIHWGLYAGPGRGEWVMENHAIKPEDYRRLAYAESGEEWFDARDYDPRQWTALAKAMGARYVTLTTMHHDGFALFESKAPGAFTAKQTLNRDLVREFVDACRADSLRVGFYKTLINWRYPGYYDIYGTGCRPNKFGYTTAAWHKDNVTEMKNELYCQMRELMSNYGTIDLLFWDGGWIAQEKGDREGAIVWEPFRYLTPGNPWPVAPMYQMKDSSGRALGLIGMIRQLQPDILMNARSGWVGDYRNEEGSHATRGNIREQLTEKCFCVANGSWGYSDSYEKPERLIPLPRLQRMVADCMIRGEVVHINVAPDRHGRIPDATCQHLTRLGHWIKSHATAIYGTKGGPWQPVDGKYGYTYNGNTLYVWLLDEFDGDMLALPAIDKGMKLKRCYQVDTQSKVAASQKGQIVTLRGLPHGDGQIRVIAIELNKQIRSAD